MRKQFLLLLTAILCALNVWAEKPSWVRDGDDWFDGTRTLLISSNLGESAYANRTEIVQVMFATGVSTIGESAFAGCTNITLVMLAEVSSIGDNAFSGCTGLTSVTIPNSVTSIGDWAFEYCTGLTSIEIPNSVTSIGNEAFSGCTGLTSVTIPNSVTSIGDYAFYGCTGLTSLTIPNSVTSIGDYAFYGCTGFTSLSIPSNVASIGNGAFAGCSNITDVKCYPTAAGLTWGDASSDFKASKATLCHVSPSQLSAYQTKFPDANLTFVGDLPPEWVQPGDEWDYETSTLTVNSNPGDQAYFSNPLIQHVIISGTVTDIGMRAFLHCSALTTVTIPNSVKSIGTIAFASCSNLATVTIGNSVTNIGDWAFADCSSLASLTCAAATPPTLGNNVFLNVPTSTCTLYVPKGSEEVYNARDQWAEFTNIVGVDVPSEDPFVDGIWYNFDDEHLTAEVTYQENEYDRYSGDVVIPASVTYNAQTYTVTSIGEGAFYDCSGLTSIEIPNSVTSIGNEAFAWCTGLTSMTIPNSVTSIGNNAFEGCSGLTSMTIPNSVTSIGYNAFRGCSGLTSVTIPNSVKSIGEGAFSFCSGLTSMTIPSSVTSIGEGAFSFCSSLTWVTIPSSVTSIGNRTFYNCSGLTSVEIPNIVTSIGDAAFYECSGLTSIEIPNSVTSIGNEAFAWCTGLTDITNYATTPQSINSDVFSNVNKSTCELNVPKKSVSLYQAANVWKDFGNIVGVDVPGEDPEEPIETIEGDYTINYVDKESQALYNHVVTLYVPVAPTITGFKFLKWVVVNGDLDDGITIQAVYQADVPSAAPEVYTNPANPAQKLIRNGNVYILTDDKTYTIQGNVVK